MERQRANGGLHIVVDSSEPGVRSVRNKAEFLAEQYEGVEAGSSPDFSKWSTAEIDWEFAQWFTANRPGMDGDTLYGVFANKADAQTFVDQLNAAKADYSAWLKNRDRHDNPYYMTGDDARADAWDQEQYSNMVDARCSAHLADKSIDVFAQDHAASSAFSAASQREAAEKERRAERLQRGTSDRARGETDHSR